MFIHMRTNIVLNDDLMREAQYSTARSNRALVHEALETYVAVKNEQRRRATYRDRLSDIRKRTAQTRTRTPSDELVRTDRDRRS